MTTVLRTILVLLGLLLLAAEPVLGGRRSRDRRRRRRRRTRAAKCVAASAYNVRIKSIKKEQRTELETIQAESDDEAWNTCFINCVESGQKMQFFVVEMPEDNESTDYGCYCTRGKLKKTAKGGFEVFTGPLDLDSGTLLVSKSKKYLKGDERLEGDACQTTLPDTPAPTPAPTNPPSTSPSTSPSVSPTPSPTMSYSTRLLFRVNKGGKVDASKLWTGADAPSGDNVRSDDIDKLDTMNVQELVVGVYKGGRMEAHFTFANAGGKTGWFSFDNLVASSYPDLNAKPEFFILNTWDEADPTPVQQNWDGQNVVEQWHWFSEENNGWSEIKGMPVVGMACNGGYCDNKKLRWTSKFGDIVNQDPQFIKEISEENGRNDVRCPKNKPLVCKIQCTGDNCDNMRVHCCSLMAGWAINYDDVAYSGWFSDETPRKDCGGDRYTAGLKCRGSYCDDVEMYCLKLTKEDSVGRDFYITKSHGGCEKDNGWLTVDSGRDGNTWDPCSWEGEGNELAIYYAPGNKLANPYQGNVAEADYMTVEAITYKPGYQMVYKLGTNHDNQFNFYEQWMSGGAIGMGDDDAMNPADATTNFRSTLLDTFMRRNQAGRVKVELYAGGEVVKTIEFMVNPGDAGTNGWMATSNILSSDWGEVKPGMTANFFSVKGDEAGNRRMFIQKEYGGCEIDNGWLVVQTMRRDSMCPWEADGKQPLIYYAPGDNSAKWQTAGDFAAADTMVVSVDFRRAIPYTRKVKGCVNGANIVKTTMRTVAECARECDANDACVAFEYGVNYGAQNAYAAYDCQLQSSADSKDCNGADHNLDLYTKMER